MDRTPLGPCDLIFRTRSPWYGIRRNVYAGSMVDRVSYDQTTYLLLTSVRTYNFFLYNTNGYVMKFSWTNYKLLGNKRTIVLFRHGV